MKRENKFTTINYENTLINNQKKKSGACFANVLGAAFATLGRIYGPKTYYKQIWITIVRLMSRFLTGAGWDVWFHMGSRMIHKFWEKKRNR